MSETIINPSSAAPPDPTDQGRTETFCRYLARQFVANKGFGFGTVPEAEKLIAASDIVLTQNREAPFTILCLIDREANPARTFDLSLPELEIIGRDCMKYADVIEIFGRPEISVAIRVIEVGATSDARWQRLKTLTSNTPDARYHASALAVDPAKGEVRWNTRLDRPERTFIEDVLHAPRLPASPRESDADFNPLVAIAPPSFPILTTGILAVLVAVFAAEIGFGVDAWSGPLRPSVKTLVAFGGLSQNLVLQSGEWYRLFSAPFLHADAFHLAMNAVALLLAGRVLERLIGRAWFGAVYAVAALCGAWVSMLLNPSALVAVGASGAIMGLFAAMLVASLHFPPGGVRRRLQGNATGVLIPSLLPLAGAAQGQRIDYAAHFGGAIGGVAVALVMLNVWSRNEALPRSTKAAAAIAIAGVLALAYPAISIARHLQAESFAPWLQAVTSGPQFKLIPPDLLPQTADNMKIQAGWLSAYYPRDPRLHLYKATELLKFNDLNGAEREARIGLAEEDFWRSMLPPEVAQNLLTVLAVAISPDRRSQALAIARPVCAAVTDGPMRTMLDDRNLCGT
jgi:rhomboid protease GluP